MLAKEGQDRDATGDEVHSQKQDACRLHKCMSSSSVARFRIGDVDSTNDRQHQCYDRKGMETTKDQRADIGVLGFHPIMHTLEESQESEEKRRGADSRGDVDSLENAVGVVVLRLCVQEGRGSHEAKKGEQDEVEPAQTAREAVTEDDEGGDDKGGAEEGDLGDCEATFGVEGAHDGDVVRAWVGLIGLGRWFRYENVSYLWCSKEWRPTYTPSELIEWCVRYSQSSQHDAAMRSSHSSAMIS